MNARATGAGAWERPSCSLRRVVYDRDEVYAFGLWFPTVRDFDGFTQLVDPELHRLEAGERAPAGARERSPLVGVTDIP